MNFVNFSKFKVQSYLMKHQLILKWITFLNSTHHGTLETSWCFLKSNKKVKVLPPTVHWANFNHPWTLQILISWPVGDPVDSDYSKDGLAVTDGLIPHGLAAHTKLWPFSPALPIPVMFTRVCNVKLKSKNHCKMLVLRWQL